jgi:hypothetical protein
MYVIFLQLACPKSATKISHISASKRSMSSALKDSNAKRQKTQSSAVSHKTPEEETKLTADEKKTDVNAETSADNPSEPSVKGVTSDSPSSVLQVN